MDFGHLEIGCIFFIVDSLSGKIDPSQEELFFVNFKESLSIDFIIKYNGINRVTWQPSSHSYKSFLKKNL